MNTRHISRRLWPALFAMCLMMPLFEEPKTKVKFTITDRNIADNTCGVR